MNARYATSARLFRWAVLGVALVAGCAELKRAPSAGPADAGRDAVDAGVREEASDSDAGAPPADFACVDWSNPTVSACASRHVRVVDNGPVVDVRGVAIARTLAGRVGIAYNREIDAQSGELALQHFLPIAPGYAAPVELVRGAGFAVHNGQAVRLGAAAPDSLMMLSFDVDDSVHVGELNLLSLDFGKEPLASTLVATGLRAPSEIGFAVDSSGKCYASARVATDTSSAKVAAWEAPLGGAFLALPDLAADVALDVVPRAGATSLFVDRAFQLHAIHHYPVVAAASAPRYNALAGATWTARKTVDFNSSGISGYDPHVAAFGNSKFAAYFVRRSTSTPGAATADLRLATWEAASDTPRIEVIEQSIVSTDVTRPGYRVAMAVDKFGLVHLVFARPVIEAEGYVAYIRQVRSPSGTRWVRDVIDGDAFSDLVGPEVDILVDEMARPHIAYVSGKDGRVRYATRFDR